MQETYLFRVANAIEKGLTSQQAGFFPGDPAETNIALDTHWGQIWKQKSYCHGMCWPHRRLWHSVSPTACSKDLQSTCIIQMTYDFMCHLNGAESKWRKQKNELPQGSVPSPILFNVLHTKDEPIGRNTEHFLYADNRALAAQRESFEDAERTLNRLVQKLYEQYTENESWTRKKQRSCLPSS